MNEIILGPLKIPDTLENREHFTYEDEDFQTGEKIKNLMAIRKDGYLLVPRYGLGPDRFKDTAILSDGVDIEIESDITFRDKIQEEAYQYMLDNNECYIELKPGKGKTVISIAAMCTIKKKTLILVDQTNLLIQWKDRIKQFTNLNEDDIGVFVGGTKELDKPVVIGMIRTLSNRVKKEYDILYSELSDFGLVIFDEVHCLIGPQQNSIPSYAVSSKRLIGLSATPYRSDGKTEMIHQWFNYKTYSDSGWGIKPMIYTYHVNSRLTHKDVHYIMNNYMKDPKTGKKINRIYFNKARWNKKFRRAPGILESIADIVKSYTEDPKNQILVACTYVDTLQHLYHHLKTMMPDLDVGLYTGSTGKLTKEELKTLTVAKLTESLEHQVILSSYNKVNKGIDKPTWNILVMLTPISSSSSILEQLIGRICRLVPGKDKALVIDVVDISLPVAVKMAEKRMLWYKEKEFKIVN